VIGRVVNSGAVWIDEKIYNPLHNMPMGGLPERKGKKEKRARESEEEQQEQGKQLNGKMEVSIISE